MSLCDFAHQLKRVVADRGLAAYLFPDIHADVKHFTLLILFQLHLLNNYQQLPRMTIPFGWYGINYPVQVLLDPPVVPFHATPQYPCSSP